MSQAKAKQARVSYAPPDLTDPVRGSVARRHVFYLPGYDPEARSRYRLLFVRELARYAKRFGEDKRAVGKAMLSPDGLVQSWRVAADPASGGAQTHYDVLLWDDIVAKDFSRSRFVSLGLLLYGTSHAMLAGKIASFYRFNWKYGNIIIYPFVMTILLALATIAIATLVHGQLGDWYGHSLNLPSWVSIPLGLAAGFGCVKAIEAALNRIYFWQLVNDWVFNYQHGQGWRRDYEERLDVFVERILERFAGFGGQEGGPPDEVVIVGHSSGALTAVEVAAKLLARDPTIGRDGPRLALVTLGSALPLVAVQPRAERLRAEIARLVTSRNIFWIDYVAAQDWLNFPRFNPLRDLDLGLAPDAVIANPTIRSACFTDIIDAATYRKVRFRPFRMHFQFLMANDRRGEYDFFAMMLGPRPVRSRAHKFTSPPLRPLPAATVAPEPAAA